MATTVQEGKKGQPPAKTVTVFVNNKPVTLLREELTGADIKDAAVTQGVAIQRDFILSVEKGQSGNTRTIGDADTVKVHPNMRFRAIADDDNS
jgi:hypothetical protein